MSAQLPETVPALRAEDICHGTYDGPDGTHCLIGWSIFVVCSTDQGLRGKRYKQFERIRGAVRDAAGASDIANFNDANPKATVADAWNRAMASLGYLRRGDKFVMPGARAGGEGKRGRGA